MLPLNPGDCGDAGLEVVERQFARDLKDPRALVPVRLVVAVDRPQERFPRQVFGGGTVTPEPPQEPVHRLPVTSEKVIDLGAVHVSS
jgi:hypothetical protein